MYIYSYILIHFTNFEECSKYLNINTATSSVWFACIIFGCWTFLFHILRYMICQFGLTISFSNLYIFALKRHSSLEWIQKNEFPAQYLDCMTRVLLPPFPSCFLKILLPSFGRCIPVYACCDKTEARISAIHSLLPIWPSFCAAAWSLVLFCIRVIYIQ
jgi:hypothetical protein